MRWAFTIGETTGAIPQVPEAKNKKTRMPIVAAILAIVVVATVIAGTGLYFLNLNGQEPSPTGETIPLIYSYNAGEKMTYNLTETMAILGQKTTETGTTTIEILSAQAEIYTINTTTNTQYGSLSSIMTMDKTGRINDFDDLNSSVQQAFGPMSSRALMYGLGVNKSEVKVGESWQMPLNTQESYASLEGTMTCKVSEVKALTVPAGTYDVFKLEISMSNARFMSTSLNGTNIDMTMNLDGYCYLEKGTCRTVESKFEAKTSSSVMGQFASMEIEMQLTKHTR